jgi:hypothetical protein
MKVMSVDRDEDVAMVPVGVLRVMAQQAAPTKTKNKLEWTSLLDGLDQEAYENGYTLRVEAAELGSFYWRVGLGPPDCSPSWQAEGVAVSGASARRIARAVARVLCREGDRVEGLAVRKVMDRSNKT